MGFLNQLLYFQCLLLVIGLVAAVNELQLQANATLMQNETAVQRVRAGTLDYGINCSVSRYIIFTSGEKPTLVAWEVAPDDGGVGSGSCHVYLPDRAGASDRNCARMSEQLGIRLGDADRPETGLKIGLVNASHGGWYKCRVYIDNLLYIGHTRLLVEDKPSAPTDLRLTPISSDTLVANWSPPASNGNLQLLRYELSGSGLRLNGSSKLKLLIGNLSPHKVYCLSVLAVNAAGRGPSTESVCNRTLEGSPEPGALRVELHSVNDTMAVLRFHIALDKMAGQFRLVRLEPRLLWHLEAPGRLSAGSQAQKNIVIAAEEFNNSIVTTRALTDLKPYSRYRLLYSVSNGAESGSAGSIDFNTTDGLAPAPTLLLYQLSIFDVNLTASCAPKGRVNGRFNGYRLFVYLQSNKSIVFERNFGPDAVNLSVTGLKPYTSYLLSAAIVTTRVGEESSPTPVLTDPGAPTAPINFTASPAKARAGLLLSWDHKPVGFRDTADDKSFPIYMLTYRVYWLFVINSGLELPPSYWDVPLTLDQLSNCDCKLATHVSCRPTTERICLLLPQRELTRSLSLITDKIGQSTVGLSDQLRIRLWIQAVGKSSYDTEHRRYFGDRSEPADASVSISDYEAGGLGRAWSKFPGGRRKNGESATDNDDSNLSPAVAVGVVVGSIAAVLGVGFILLLGWRWIFVRHRGYQRPFSQGLETFECLTADNEQGGHSSHSAGSSRAQLKRYSQTEHKAMSVAEFRDHVIASHANDNSAFQLEFEEIQRVTHKDWQAYHAKHPDNLSKNRYTDICPYDHSRVVLLSNPGKKMGDYINANYVDGYRRDKAYIACQGPVPSTFDDFWLMVWENRCTAIVMISNFVERGRRKCDQYWPSSGSEVYGAISVKLIRQLNKAAYCMREFSIRNLRAKKLAKERQLFHFHYSEWPDYGVPAYPLPVLNFVQRTAAYCGGDQSGPVVVHCSAGVGRTGTFICIESQIRQILCEKTINVRGFLEHIRQQRMRLVQTEEQYIFIHDVLLEFLLCPEREIPMERLPDYFSNLMEETEPCGCTGLETQYQLCVAHQPADYELASALKACNYAKNRADVYPIESRRVKLTCKPGVDGSDYINASHVHGYQSVNEFIVTQLPMKDTLFDFYRMIWEQNCVCIVSVHPSLYSDGAGDTANNEQEGIDLPEMWPTNESEALTAGYLQVWFRSRQDYPFGECREFLLASNKDDYSVLTSVWTLKRWPDTFGESISLIELVKAVSNTRGLITLSPIIVMDMYGGSYAGIICSLYVLYRQLIMEGTADVYSLFKLYHLQRPGMFNSKADMEFIYAVISFHAKYFSPSNSLSLRRGNGGAGPGITITMATGP
ncbi:hypothetical protein BOX15_Mlig033324g1 [Macrostomum lignano]|uniref:Uncharacterized protein n=1 Tax=Macrostomum lignano TaxID=282301 RepID=A0A267DS36_9PLAT|nr:hypothetical protein BOX15_Mlig033324g1 [Macrostomum lignano]